MDRRLDTLDLRFRPMATELLARLVEAGIMVMIVNTRRTAEEQAAAILTGHSWVGHSRHQDGLAIDLCPYETWQLHGPDKLRWSGADDVWLQLGLIGESLGLRWGGRWKQADLGHFELALPALDVPPATLVS